MNPVITVRHGSQLPSKSVLKPASVRLVIKRDSNTGKPRDIEARSDTADVRIKWIGSPDFPNCKFQEVMWVAENLSPVDTLTIVPKEGQRQFFAWTACQMDYANPKINSDPAGLKPENASGDNWKYNIVLNQGLPGQFTKDPVIIIEQ